MSEKGNPVVAEMKQFFKDMTLYEGFSDRYLAVLNDVTTNKNERDSTLEKELDHIFQSLLSTIATGIRTGESTSESSNEKLKKQFGLSQDQARELVRRTINSLIGHYKVFDPRGPFGVEDKLKFGWFGDPEDPKSQTVLESRKIDFKGWDPFTIDEVKMRYGDNPGLMIFNPGEDRD